jgi:hypothetical protein
MQLEVGWAWALRSGSGFLLHKTQSLSPRVRLGPKPNIVIYVVKPEPEESPTYLVIFSSLKKPEPKVWSLSLTQAQKNQAWPTSTRSKMYTTFQAVIFGRIIFFWQVQQQICNVDFGQGDQMS